ncbi:MAG: acyl-CoA-binding protein [Flavobacteriaceae bacterium]|nr:acyl-CoA-binding protein [Flavobacteriaceae bacterium]
MNISLDKEFKESFNQISALQENLSPDIMLKLYAYYKQAISGDILSFEGEQDVRKGFKFNAWKQLNGMSQEKAKEEYINLAKTILITKTNLES